MSHDMSFQAVGVFPLLTISIYNFLRSAASVLPKGLSTNDLGLKGIINHPLVLLRLTFLSLLLFYYLILVGQGFASHFFSCFWITTRGTCRFLICVEGYPFPWEQSASEATEIFDMMAW